MLTDITRLLIFDRKTHAGVAIEIETNGVYSKDAITGQLVYHRPDSYQAEEALMGVSVDYIHRSHGEDDGEFEAFWGDQDPNDRYGWPTAAIPNFSNVIELGWLELPSRFPDRSRYCPYHLFTIGRLLITGRATPATIGTALERQGIYATNDIGQLKVISGDFFESADIRSALADYINIGFFKTWNHPQALGNMVYWSSGWPLEALPDFNAIAAEPVPPPSIVTSSSANTASVEAVPETQEHFTGSNKAENANLAIIGGLLAIIQGQLNCSPHSDFRSQNEIIGKLKKELEGLPGTSVRNLKEKFAKANRLLQEYLDPSGDSK